MTNKTSNILFIVIILAIILIPICTMNLLPDQVSVIENRNLAELIPISEGLDAYMDGVDNYFDDRIGFREEIMKLYNQWNYSILKGNHKNVISADEGWLFYKESIADYTGTNIDLNKTQKQVEILEGINKWCKERDIVFIFAIGPNKATIYNNYLPDSIRSADKTNLDILLDALEKTDIKVLCPKDELIANRDNVELYFKQDTHWNHYGSRFLLDEITDTLNFPEYDIPITEKRESSGDLLTMLGTGANKYTSLITNIQKYEGATIESVDGTKHMIINSPGMALFVCYRDSFNTAMIGYYSYYFDGPVYWQYNIDFDYVEKEKPQYLILSSVERYLDIAINSNEGILTR